MSDEKYQGFANYETWLVDLWLGNDEGIYNQRRRMARRAKDIGELAQEIKAWVEDEMIPDLGCTLAQDLLLGALGSVVWIEVAETGFEDIGRDRDNELGEDEEEDEED